MKNPCKYQITIWPRSSDSFYMVSYYIKWVNTSWTHSTSLKRLTYITNEKPFYQTTMESPEEGGGRE